MKATELTLGDLHVVRQSGLRPWRHDLTDMQKSAEGIVGSDAEGPNGARKGLKEGRVGLKSNEQKAAENSE